MRIGGADPHPEQHTVVMHTVWFPAAAAATAQFEAVPWTHNIAVAYTAFSQRCTHVRAGIRRHYDCTVGSPCNQVDAGYAIQARLIGDAARRIDDVPVAVRPGQREFQRVRNRRWFGLLPVGITSARDRLHIWQGRAEFP